MSKWVVARVRVSDDTVEIEDDTAASIIEFGVEQGTAQYSLEDDNE